jgi:hypothetical protein
MNNSNEYSILDNLPDEKIHFKLQEMIYHAKPGQTIHLPSKEFKLPYLKITSPVILKGYPGTTLKVG